MRWLVTNRLKKKGVFGAEFGDLTYWVLKEGGNSAKAGDWLTATVDEFQRQLLAVVNRPFLQRSSTAKVRLRTNRSMSAFSYTATTTGGMP